MCGDEFSTSGPIDNGEPGLSAPIVAVFLVAAALLGAIVIFPFRSVAWFRRAILFWLLITPALFFNVENVFVGLVIVAALAALMLPRSEFLVAPFYIVALFAAPPEYRANIPLSASMQLLPLSSQQTISMVVFAMTLTTKWSVHPPYHRSLPAKVLVSIGLYCALIAILSLRETTFTDAIRRGMSYGLSIWLLVFLMLRTVNSKDDVWNGLKAILAVAVVFSLMSFLVQIRSWNFYSYLNPDFSIWKGGEYRFGFLRTSLTVSTGLLGFVTGFGMIVTLALQERISLTWRSLLIGCMTFSCFVSLARGAWLAVALMLVSFYVFRSKLSGMSLILRVIPVFIVAGLVSWFDLLEYSVPNDPFGTFEYREELFSTSWSQFLDAPLLGQVDFIETGRFDHLVQGEGIIDIVSVYLQVVLSFGLVGLLVFLAPFGVVIAGLLRLRERCLGSRDQSVLDACAVLLPALLGYLFLIGTTSAVSLISETGALIVGLSAALCRIGHQPSQADNRASVLVQSGLPALR